MSVGIAEVAESSGGAVFVGLLSSDSAGLRTRLAELLGVAGLEAFDFIGVLRALGVEDIEEREE